MKPIVSRRNFESSRSFILVISLPHTFIVPSKSLSSPPIRYSSVDFPLPDAPIRDTNSPCLTSSDILLSTFAAASPFPKVLLTFVTSIRFILFLPPLFIFKLCRYVHFSECLYGEKCRKCEHCPHQQTKNDAVCDAHVYRYRYHKSVKYI